MDPEDSEELQRLKRDRKKAEKKNRIKDVATITNSIGELLARHGQYEESIGEHETERSLCETLQDVIGEAVACRKIGECYAALQQYDKALRLQKRHLDLAQSCDDPVEEQRAWATIGRTYYLQLQVTESTKFSGTSQEIAKKADDAFMRSLEVCEKLKTTIKLEEYMAMKARLFLNMGLVYDVCGDVKKSAEYIKRAISISEKYKLYDDVYRCQYSLSGIYQRSGQISQALRALDEAQKNAQKLKDKYFESDALLQKAQLQISIGDFDTAKHGLKKAKKLGFAQPEEYRKLHKLYKSACKMKESCEDLETTDNESYRMKLYESLADSSVEAGNLNQALDYYHKQLQCAVDINLDSKSLIPIYVSLAQTYADNENYREAIKYYKLELNCHDNLEQICRTHLNLADLEERLNLGYSKIRNSYIEAFEAARKTKHRKLQVQVLKSLTEVQKQFKQEEHLTITAGRIKTLEEKYSSQLNCVSDEDDSQPIDSTVEDVIISDLSESEDEEVSVERCPVTQTTRCVRNISLKTKRNEKGETPLHRACIEGNLKKVQKLIQQGHGINPRDHCGWIPLHEAANHDYYDIVEYLVDHGASINDRGGERCGGVTPLIDAACCGNMDVMKLLINRGANILAKDDEGQTALDCLMEWHERCEDTRTQDLQTQYLNTVNLLQNNSGVQTSMISPVTVSSVSQDTDDLLSTLPVCKKSKRQKELVAMKKSTQALIVEDEDSESEDTYNSEEIYQNNILQDLNETATDGYRNAISSVGISAQKLASQVLKQSQNVRSLEASQPTSALVGENSHIGDDWLIDDMAPTKRKFKDCDGFMSGSSSSRSNNSNNNNKRQKLTGDSISHRNSHSLHTIDEEITVIDISDSSPLPSLPTLTRKTEHTLSLKRKPKQMRITSFGASSSRKESTFHSNDRSNSRLRNIDSWDSDSSNSMDSAAHVFGNTAPSSVASVASFGSSLPQSSNTSANQTLSANVMRLKVKLKDKTLLIPVSFSDQNNIISWLAQQVSQRYFSIYGIRPLLTLSTVEGAIFSPDDIISMVLNNNDELQADIKSWDLPPLNKRYKQSCKTLSTVVYSNISNLLQVSETTGHLILKDLALRPNQLQPVFRALQGTNNISILNLQGNRMGDAGLENLSKNWDSLPNLTTLNLGCNNITAVGLQYIIDGLQSTSQSKYLQVLSKLNLEKNSLGDNSISLIILLISSLPALSSLNISCCLFTCKCFQDHRIQLANTLAASSIEELDVSYNKFGSLGIELLIKCLNSQKIRKLFLSDTQIETTTSHLSLHLQHYFTQAGCVLQELDISSCNLSSHDVQFIIRIPSFCITLHRLVMCKNIQITNSVMELLLQQIVESKDSCLDEVIINGCSVKSPLQTPLLDSLSDTLCRHVPLRYFSLTCDKVDKVDLDCLQEVWKEKWKDLSHILIQGNYIQLSVSQQSN